MIKGLLTASVLAAAVACSPALIVSAQAHDMDHGHHMLRRHMRHEMMHHEMRRHMMRHEMRRHMMRREMRHNM